MSLSPGREQLWRQRGGLLRSENLRREGALGGHRVGCKNNHGNVG